MYKKIFSIILLTLLTPMLSFAAVTDFSATANVTVSDITFGSGTTTLLILSGSEAEEVVFDDDLTVTNPGSQFKVGSSNSSVISIVVSQNSSTVACEANSAPGTSFVSVPTTSGTYVVTPSASACPSSGGSSGGGGGGNTRQLRTTVSPNAGSPFTPSYPTPASTPNPKPSALFPTNLPYGSVSEDVRRLQSLLASDASLYPEGMVTGKFGPLTKQAVERFQLKYGVVASPTDVGYGVVGPKTREKLEEVFASGTATNSPTTAPTTETPSINPKPTLFERNLPPGSASPDVRLLQTLLATDKDVYPEGTVSGFYGPLTRKAVERFQAKYGVAKQGDTGYGVVGPATRAKLNEVFGQ